VDLHLAREVGLPGELLEHGRGHVHGVDPFHERGELAGDEPRAGSEVEDREVGVEGQAGGQGGEDSLGDLGRHGTAVIVRGLVAKEIGHGASFPVAVVPPL